MTAHDDLCRALLAERFTTHQRTTQWQSPRQPSTTAVERLRELDAAVAGHEEADVIHLDHHREAS